MSEVIEVGNVENNTTSYVDLVRHDCPTDSKGTRIDSFTIMPILNPDKALFRCEFNGDEKFTDFKIGVEVEYPFPLPYHDPWKVQSNQSLILQMKSVDGTNVGAIGKIIGRKL